MSKDVTRRPDLTKLERAGIKRTEGRQTEVEAGKKALAERLLFGTSTRPQQAGPPRIILALDCTSSMGEYLEERRITPDAAATIANKLFAGAGAAGLQVRLWYFRGDGDDQHSKRPRQLRHSDEWYTTPEELARKITAIEHWPGWTQHCALLRHVITEAEKQAIQQVVIISDAFERQTPRRPDGDDLMAARVHAARLRQLGVTLVVGYKGTIVGACPFDRAGKHAERDFLDITRENGGYCFLYDPTQLGERFGQIAAQARLTAQGDAAGARLMLEHMQSIPFEMTVGECVPSARCASASEESEE
jgi:hypothetical protein